MNENGKSENPLEHLTPHEREVLRKRFGTNDKSKCDSSVPLPPTTGEDKGSGGAPTPVISLD